MLCRASAIALAIVVGACAAKTTTPLPAPSAAKFPEFIQPPVSRSLAANPAAVTSQQRGWQFLQGGDLRNAEREFKLALAVAPQFYPADTSLGYLELARKQPADALPHFEKALAADGRDVSALVGGGLAFLALNRESDALFAFESATAVDPSLVDIKRRVEVLRFRGLGQDLAAARQAAADGKLDEAARAYASAISSSPDSPFLYRELAVVERRQGNTEAALADFRKALALDPTDASSSVGVGDLLAESGDLEGAEKAYTDALLLEPSEAVDVRLDAVRAQIELARLPAEYRAIETRTADHPGRSGGAHRCPAGAARAGRPPARRHRRHRYAQSLGVDVDHGGRPRGDYRSLRQSHVPAALAAAPYGSCGGHESPAVTRRGIEPGARPCLGIGAHPVLRSLARTPGVSGGVDGRCSGRHEDGGGQRLPADTDRQRRGSRRRDRARRSAGRRAGAGRCEPGARSRGAEMIDPGPFTTANQITLLRMLLIPAFVTLVIYHELGWALIVFATAGISDAADGLIARRAGQKTSLGAWLDPMADKLLLVSTFIVLTVPGLGLTNRLPIWLTALVISRDVVIVVTVAIVNLAIGRRTFRPSMFGKFATGTYIVTAVMAMLYNYRGFHSPMVDLCVYASLAITLVSGFHYIWHAARIIQP